MWILGRERKMFHAEHLSREAASNIPKGDPCPEARAWGISGDALENDGRPCTAVPWRGH